MSDMNVNVNITPPTPALTKGQSFHVTGESVQPAVSAVQVAEVLQPAASVAKESEQRQLSAETVKAAAVVGNVVLQAANKNLQFQVDEATKQVVVKIVDSKTGEVVRQIPTVEMLDFIRAMKQQEDNNNGRSRSGMLLKAVV